MGLPVTRVMFAKKGSLSRTTSGKVQRREMRLQLDVGKLSTIWDSQMQMLETSPEQWSDQAGEQKSDQAGELRASRTGADVSLSSV